MSTFPFVVLHEDDDVCAIDKPAGLVVHRGFSGDRDSVVDRLRACGRADLHTVHRLDRGTSGVLLLGKNPRVARVLAESFAAGLVHKTYLALVRGAFPDEIFVDHAIPRDEGGERVPARTWFRSLGMVTVPSTLREPRYSLVRAWPETGRFHQVRRHLAHLRHPIIGDANYGKGEHNRFCRDTFGLGRLALHAETLALPSPPFATTTITGPLALELAGAFTSLGFAAETWTLPTADERRAPPLEGERP